MQRRALLLACLVLACKHQEAAAPPPAAQPPPKPDAHAAWKGVVDAPDRTEKDRELDAGRRPAETLEFLDVKPGMKVADLGAGGGYTTELLARAVGPSGAVYMQNDPSWLGFLQAALMERFDHRLLLQRDDPAGAALRAAGETFVALEVSPTAENLARLAYEHARERGLAVVAVELVEQPGSVARYAP